MYKKAFSKTDLTANDRKTIKRQYLKGILDKRVQARLMGLPESELGLEGNKGLVETSKYFSQQIKAVLGNEVDNHVHMVSAMTKAINEMNLFTQNAKQELFKSKNNLKCFKCGAQGHFQRDCRSSDKSRRQNNRRANASVNHKRPDHMNSTNNYSKNSYRPLRDFPNSQFTHMNNRYHKKSDNFRPEANNFRRFNNPNRFQQRVHFQQDESFHPNYQNSSNYQNNSNYDYHYNSTQSNDYGAKN